MAQLGWNDALMFCRMAIGDSASVPGLAELPCKPCFLPWFPPDVRRDSVLAHAGAKAGSRSGLRRPLRCHVMAGFKSTYFCALRCRLIDILTFNKRLNFVTAPKLSISQ